MIVEYANPTKLHDELIASGIKVSMLENDRKNGQVVAENTFITFGENVDMDLVQQVIDKHDPTPLPAEPDEKERLEVLEETILFLLTGGL